MGEYTPQTWASGSAGGTPVSATRLNYIEAGIEAIDTELGDNPSGTEDNVAARFTALEGDSRWTDARTPTAHAATHEDGGSDELNVAALGSASAAAGYVPTADGSGGITWAAQTGGGLSDPGHSGAVTVAAYEAPQSVKDAADYTCDGTADEVQINLALKQASRPGAGWSGEGQMRVQLLGPRFNLADQIDMPPEVTLAGQGPGTLLRPPTSGLATDYAIGLLVSDSAHVCIQDLTIGREADVLSAWGGIGLIGAADGDSYSIYTGSDGFSTIRNVMILKTAGKGIVVGGVGGTNGQRETQIDGCYLWNIRDIGIHIDGGSDAKIRNCVVASGRNGAGFHIGGGNTLVSGCKAYYRGNPGYADNGFTIASSRCQITGCEAQDNGGWGFAFTGTEAHGSSLLADSNSAYSSSYGGYSIGVDGAFAGLHATDRAQSTNRQNVGIAFSGSPRVMLTGYVKVDSGSNHVTGTLNANSYARVVRDGTTLWSTGS